MAQPFGYATGWLVLDTTGIKQFAI